MTRRDLMKVGVMGAGTVSLPQLLATRAAAQEAKRPIATEKSIVWLWLGGGPTHVETFDPKMTAPSEYRSVTGEVSTNVPGVTLGGSFENLATVADKMAFVRSFAHTNSGHGGGTHYVMTGYNHPPADNSAQPIRPSMGSIVSRVRGCNDPVSGMPTYVRMNGIYSDGPAFLGTAFAPFDPNGAAQKNMSLQTNVDRLADRRSLLSGLDRLNRDVDRSGLMQGLDEFEQQAFSLVLGKAPEAFDLKKEDPRVLARYGINDGQDNRRRRRGGLGQQMLMARRLCEVGCGFVTIHFGGWDMHGNIKRGMDNLGPQVDHAVATFLDDVAQRGMSDNILLVITGEFGRTPRVNRNAGRDHWAPLSTLALAGGGLKMGQVVGESNSKAEVPKSTPITPQDLMATIFHTLNIDQKIQFPSQAGRPTFMNENGKTIVELV
ncbi:MAG: DUF1501 domain-containing protein [Planctomycetota bacterium]|nr:DUF1501 domain-containing protein [Planctomycetota bacterium]